MYLFSQLNENATLISKAFTAKQPQALQKLNQYKI